MKFRFLHIVLFWSAFTVFMTAVMLLVHPVTNRPVSVLAEFVWEAAFAAVWTAGTPAVFALAVRFPLTSGRKARNMMFLSLSGIALSAMLCVAHGFLIYLFHPEAGAFHINILLTSLFYNIDKMLLIFAGLVILHQTMEYRETVQQQALTAAQLSTQLSQAEMTALKMQLQPHFLFNTLNAIVTLVRKDPDQAEEMIVRLSEFLRITLETSGRQMVPLRDELVFIRSYLAIEEVRFGGRLRFTESVPSDVLDIPVPMLILQPLIENAVRHGFSRYEDASVLIITASLAEGMLLLQVEDDAAPHMSTEGLREGIGLSNVRNRLRTQYGERASFTVTPRTPRGVSAELRMPAEGHA